MSPSLIDATATCYVGLYTWLRYSHKFQFVNYVVKRKGRKEKESILLVIFHIPPWPEMTDINKLYYAML